MVFANKFPQGGEIYAIEATAYSPRSHYTSTRIDFGPAKHFRGSVRPVLSPVTAPGPRLNEQVQSSANLMLKKHFIGSRALRDTRLRNSTRRSSYIPVLLQGLGIQFDSDEPICQIVNGASAQLWESSWIANDALRSALDVRKIVIADAGEAEEVVQPEEVQLFKENAWVY